MFDCIQADGQFIVTKAGALESSPCILTCTSWSKWRPKLGSWYHISFCQPLSTYWFITMSHQAGSRQPLSFYIEHWTPQMTPYPFWNPLKRAGFEGAKISCVWCSTSRVYSAISKWHAFGARSWWQTKDSCPPRWPCSCLPILRKTAANSMNSMFIQVCEFTSKLSTWYYVHITSKTNT